MMIEKLLSGGYLISQRDKQGNLFKMRFMDYTKKEAIQKFKYELETYNKNLY